MMSDEIFCTCGHIAQDHTYSLDYSGCDHCDCTRHVPEIVADHYKAQTAALRTAAREVLEFLKKAADDVFCDNDGRGCGTGHHAREFADALAARLDGEE